jgi:hypothetical protein
MAPAKRSILVEEEVLRGKSSAAQGVAGDLLKESHELGP